MKKLFVFRALIRVIIFMKIFVKNVRLMMDIILMMENAKNVIIRVKNVKDQLIKIAYNVETSFSLLYRMVNVNVK